MNNTFFYESTPLKDFKWASKGDTAIFWGDNAPRMESRINAAMCQSEARAQVESFTCIEQGPLCFVMVRATIIEAGRARKPRGRPRKVKS